MFTFDGLQKLIVLDSGTVSFSVPDLYTSWQAWDAGNPGFDAAFSSPVGGQALGGGATLGVYYFLSNGWQIRPQEADHVLRVDGNLYTDPETAERFAPTLGAWRVTVLLTLSSLTELASTPLSSSESTQLAEIHAAVTSGTFGVTSSSQSSINDPIGVGGSAVRTVAEIDVDIRILREARTKRLMSGGVMAFTVGSKSFQFSSLTEFSALEAQLLEERRAAERLEGGGGARLLDLRGSSEDSGALTR